MNAMIRIFFFERQKHDACEAIMRINKQQMKEDRKLKKKKKLNGNTACECDDKKKKCLKDKT